MARQKLLSDPEILGKARLLYRIGGNKAVSFGAVSRACGLAASTLAQRFGTVDLMLAAAARAGWDELIAAAAEADAQAANKGASGYLKALGNQAQDAAHLLELGARDPAARELAQAWRGQVECALGLRLGQGQKARQAAKALFAAWQGQSLWRQQDLSYKELARLLA